MQFFVVCLLLRVIANNRFMKKSTFNVISNFYFWEAYSVINGIDCFIDVCSSENDLDLWEEHV